MNNYDILDLYINGTRADRELVQEVYTRAHNQRNDRRERIDRINRQIAIAQHELAVARQLDFPSFMIAMLCMNIRNLQMKREAI